MNQKQFEETFAARKLAYKEKSKELARQQKALRDEYHKGNAELEELRRKTVQCDPKKRRKHACYALQAYLGGIFNDWQSQIIDTTQAVVHFNCCEDDAAVFTITIPYGSTEKPE